MASHEAGALHADAGSRGPLWLRVPADINALVPRLWPRTVERAAGGVLRVGSVGVDVIAGFGTPAYVVDENDLVAARDFKVAFDKAFATWHRSGAFYAGKAFEPRHRSVDRGRGPEPRRVYRRRARGCAAGGFPPDRIGMHGNNKSEAELARALAAGVGRIVVDSAVEIDRLSRLARDLGTRKGDGAHHRGSQRTPTVHRHCS